MDIPATVKEIVEADDGIRVVFDDGREVTSEVVVLATGVRYRSLPAAGLDRFQTSNVFYAATAQEARVCGDGADEHEQVLDRKIPQFTVCTSDGDPFQPTVAVRVDDFR